MQHLKILLGFILFLSLQANGKKKPEFLTFTSKKGGYEFSYPSCMKIEASNADEADLKLIEVSEIAVSATPECSETLIFGGKEASSLFVYESTLTSLAFIKGIDNIEKLAKKPKSETGSNFIAVSRPKHKSNVSLVTVKENSYLRWNFYLPCKKKVFIFEIMTGHNFKIPPNLVKEINSSDYSSVKTELKIIESFKCLD